MQILLGKYYSNQARVFKLKVDVTHMKTINGKDVKTEVYAICFLESTMSQSKLSNSRLVKFSEVINGGDVEDIKKLLNERLKAIEMKNKLGFTGEHSKPSNDLAIERIIKQIEKLEDIDFIAGNKSIDVSDKVA